MVMRSAKGFSIIELVIVLSIVGILAVFVLPRFFQTESFSTRAFADHMQSEMRYARTLAQSSGCPLRVTVSAGGYQIERTQNGPPGCGGGWVTLQRSYSSADGFSGDGDKRTAPDNVSVSGSLGAFVFQPDGSAGGTNRSITVSGGANSVTVTVDGTTGLVTGS